MADPATREDYDRQAMANQRLEGFGLETTMHLSCPFCTAPDFMIYRIISVLDVLTEPHTCSSCARSLQVEVKHHDGGTSMEFVHMEFVQTGGPPPPAYLPAMRRRVTQ
jgi:hypothetical protein